MTDKAEHILFLTGKFAERPLQRVLAEMQPTEFSYEIRNIGVSVAALMTTQMISRRLDKLAGVDRIILPGLCRGDVEVLTETLGVCCVRGPIDLKALPDFFGRTSAPPDLGQYQVKIFAEITDAPLLTIEQCLQQAQGYRQAGANVIDLGCLPDTDFPHLEELISALHAEDFIVSVDSLESDELLRGGKAGADFLLSLHEDTQWIAEEVAAVPVLIAKPHRDMQSLLRLVDDFVARNRPFYADPILDPIHVGFTDSLIRYHQLRSARPDIPVLMGVGNLTELTEADTAGVNALLFGIISELDIQAVLVTQVSPHCRSAIREADWARRIMAAAKRMDSLPKGIHGALAALHERKPYTWRAEEIRALQTEVRDPSYRIHVTTEGIHVYNREGIWEDTDAFALFPQLHEIQDDAAHAFYMGVELARAQIAWQLGKSYCQDEELSWGAALMPLTDEQKKTAAKAAHDMKSQDKQGDALNAGGTTLQARRQKRRSRKVRK